MGMAAAALDQMPTRYKDPDEPTTKVNFRVPLSTEDRVFDVMRLWKILARARGKNPTNINFTFTASELLGDGAELEFAEYGGLPQDEAAWAALRAKIFEAHGKPVPKDAEDPIAKPTRPSSKPRLVKK